eukprot:361974-Chlamydomonas_euryale.AAC.2
MCPSVSLRHRPAAPRTGSARCVGARPGGAADVGVGWPWCGCRHARARRARAAVRRAGAAARQHPGKGVDAGGAATVGCN